MPKPPDPEQPKPPKSEQTSKAQRFLAPKASAGDGHGYRNRPKREPWQDVVVDGKAHTEQASPETLERIKDATSITDEPECVSGAWLDFYAESARFYESIQHDAQIQAAQLARKELPIEARMADAQRRAKMQKIDMSHEFHIARKALERARRGGGKQDKVIARMERIEARLDRPADRGFRDAA